MSFYIDSNGFAEYIAPVLMLFPYLSSLSPLISNISIPISLYRVNFNILRSSALSKLIRNTAVPFDIGKSAIAADISEYQENVAAFFPRATSI